MFDSAKYRKMIESDLAGLLNLQKEHQKRVDENSKRKEEAESKAKELEKKAQEIQHQIERLKEMAATLDTPVNGFVPRQRGNTTTAAMYGFNKSLIEPGIGIIRGVRAVVHGVNRKRLQPPDVRDILVESGFPNSKNLLSEIHAALRRLVDRGEVAPVKFPGSTKIVGYRSRGMRGRLSDKTKAKKNTSE